MTVHEVYCTHDVPAVSYMAILASMLFEMPALLKLKTILPVYWPLTNLYDFVVRLVINPAGVVLVIIAQFPLPKVALPVTL